MVPGKTLVLLTTYITAAAAFYPFVPEWKCKDEGVCVDVSSKRSVDHVDDRGIRSASLDEALTFELRQRNPSVSFL